MSQLPDTFDPYESIVKKTLDKFIPFKVDWEITYRCNLRCAHCYQVGPTSKPELSTKEIFSVIDELADLGCLYITFTGGEILLREDFFEVACYARKKEFALRIFTNGTLIDEGVADKIKALNPLTVEISLYGVDPAVHEKITRVSGSYKMTMHAFNLLRARDINTVVKCTVMNENLSEFDKLQDFARSIGSGFTFSFTLIPKINGSKELLKYRLSQEQLKMLFASQDWLVQDITKGGVPSYEPLCAAGFNSLYISPYGEVFPCVVLREECGNLKDKSLREIWESPVFKKVRNIQFKDLKDCFACAASCYCDRCAGLAWLEAGDVLGVSPNDCVLSRVRQWALERRHKGDGKKEEKNLPEARDSV